MNDNPPLTPAPAAPRPRASQDQALANRINQYRAALTFVQGHAELGALLAGRGYTTAVISQGLTLCDAAQAGFNARNEAQATQQAAVVALRTAEQAARAGFADFRVIARAVFRQDTSAQSALNVTGVAPHDREQFLTKASAAYAAALEYAAYGELLGRRGYDPAGLQAEQAKLTALTQAAVTHELARAAAQRATAERDAAAQTLDAWWAEFRAVARVVLKGRPELARALGV
jgi:hypothetical protein